MQKIPTMASRLATTIKGFVRSFGTKHTAAAIAHPTTSTQKKGASGPETSMATTSAPDPPGKAEVKRSQPKKYRSTRMNAPSILASLTICARSSSMYPARRSAIATTSTSAVPHTSALDTNHGARSAVCQNSCACCSPKIQAVTECTSTAHASATTLITRSATADTLPASARRVAHRYTTDRIR